MNLDKIAAHLRTKTPLEAVDLGFLLAQRFARPLWTAWISILGPIFLIILTISYFTASFWIPYFILWWLKPLYARIPIIVLSRAFFGSVPSHAQTLQGFAKAARKPSTLWQLTIGRLNPLRGFSMFIHDLEGGSLKQNRQRANILQNANINMTVFGLNIFALACEFTLFIACFTFIGLVIPPNVDFSLSDNIFALIDGEYTHPLFLVLVLTCYTLAFTLVEPLFAAGNFGLYISRRVELEGWDLEIALRKLTTRIQNKNQRDTATNTLVILLAAFLTSLFLLAPGPAFAQDLPLAPETAQIDQTQSPGKILIQEILKNPEFGQPELKKVWKLRNPPEPDEPKKVPSPNLVGPIVRAIIWALTIALAIALVAFLIRRFPRFPGATPVLAKDDWQQNFETDTIIPQVAPNLPIDIIAHARAAYAAGDQTRALTLLYTGMLRALKNDFGLELAPGLTAYETTRLVRKNNGPHHIVADISNAWTAHVFAHKSLDNHAFETILQRWQSTFSPRSTP